MKNYYEYIEDYLNGELPLELRIEFEEAMSQDEELRKMLHQYKDLYHRLEAAAMRRRVEAVRNIDSQANFSGGIIKDKIDKNTETPKSNVGFFLKIAASILLVISLGYLLLNDRNHDTEIATVNNKTIPIDTQSKIIDSLIKIDTIQSKKYEPDTKTKRIKEHSTKEQFAYLDLLKRHRVRPDFAALRSELNTDQDTGTLKAITAYQKNQYEEVIQILSNIQAEDESLLYLRANAYLSTQHFDEAIKDFEQLRSSFQFKYDAQWAIILSYLGKKDLNTVRALLKELLNNTEHPYYEKAVKLDLELK